MDGYDPWADLAENYPGITVDTTVALNDAGQWKGRTLHLDSQAGPAEHRCVLARELVALSRRDLDDDAIARVAAHRLITDEALSEAAQTAARVTVATLCQLLEVDEETLEARLGPEAVHRLISPLVA